MAQISLTKCETLARESRYLGELLTTTRRYATSFDWLILPVTYILSYAPNETSMS